MSIVTVYIIGVLCVVGAGALAAALVYLQHRYVSSEHRAEHNDVTGAFFEIIGVLYVVMLAFIVIAVWDTTDAAEEKSYSEANNLVQVYWAGYSAPEPQRTQIQDLCREYATVVADREWKQMEKREAISAEGWRVLDDLRTQVDSLNSRDELTRKRYESVQAKMVALTEDRQARIAASDAGLAPVLWFALIGGAVLFVAFAFLFGVPSRLPHMIMVVSVTMMVVLLLYAVYQLEYPFSRAMSVGPDAMEFALQRFGQIGS